MTSTLAFWTAHFCVHTCYIEIEKSLLTKSGRVPVKCETKSKRNKINRNEIHRNETVLFRFVSISFRVGKFRFVSVNFVSISFRILQVPVYQWCLHDSKSNWHNFHIFSSFYFIFSQSKNWITNQLHVFNPTKLQRELPLNLKKGVCHFFYKIFRFWSLEEKSN